MRKKELVKQLAEAKAEIQRRIDKSWEQPSFPWLTRAFEDGKADAEDYRPRRKPHRNVVAGMYADRWPFHHIDGFPVEQWAYDYGYDLGTKERDAFEERRDKARAAIKNPTTIPPTPVGTASQ